MGLPSSGFAFVFWNCWFFVFSRNRFILQIPGFQCFNRNFVRHSGKLRAAANFKSAVNRRAKKYNRR